MCIQMLTDVQKKFNRNHDFIDFIHSVRNSLYTQNIIYIRNMMREYFFDKCFKTN